MEDKQKNNLHGYIAPIVKVFKFLLPGQIIHSQEFANEQFHVFAS